MKKIIKSTCREIKKTLGRFLGILVIIAIGCAFFTGLKSVKPDMELAGEKYFVKSKFMDYQLLSNIGFNDQDVKSVQETKGVKMAEAFYSLDTMGSINEQSKVIKVSSLPENINMLQLREGRLPEKSGECVVLSGKIGKGIRPGDSITLTSGTDKALSESIKVDRYEVVGTVTSPLYITNELGTSRIGNGSVQEMIFVQREDFVLSVYTEISLVLDGTDNLKPFSEAYPEYIAPYRTSLEELGEIRAKERQAEIVHDAESELAEKEADYQEGIKKLEDSQAKFQTEMSDAEAKLSEAQQKINHSKKELDEKEKEYQEGIRELANKRETFTTSVAKTDDELSAAYDKLVMSDQQLAAQEKQLEELNKSFLAAKESGNASEQELAVMEQQITKSSTAISGTKQQLDKGWEDYHAKKALFEKSKADTLKELESAQKKLDATPAKLDEARESIEKGQTDIDQGKIELDEKKADALKEIEDAEKELADARVQLDDAKNKIAELDEAKWYVVDREENIGYTEYRDGSERVGGLAEILPVMFFLIAALVCLTSMTRMVDEQRTQIGTMKALGYTSGKIAFKYIFYAVSASALGSVIGVLAGYRMIPGVIFKSYKALYSLPLNQFPIQLQYALGSAIMGIAVTGLAAFFTCKASLASVPSALMRPLAPKTGKRLLLERVTFVWKRLKFSQKVTLRNIFRYKKRFIMTVFGVACCCSLVISGFGLKDSIKVPAQRQFSDIFVYDSYIRYKDIVTNVQRENIIAEVQQNSLVKEIGQSNVKSMEINNGDKQVKVTLIVPETPEELSQFIHLREPESGLDIHLTEDEAVMTEKAAEFLGIKRGDTVTSENGDGSKVQMKIGQIGENYLMNYIFMTPGYYKTVFGEDAEMNQILINLLDTNEERQSAFGEYFTGMEGVSAVGFLSEMQSNLNKTLSSLDLIVWVILISAGLLAFVVLYTLTTININERLREIATIKVLGFFDKEVNSYIFRESYILTFVGILIGIAGGTLLHQYIIRAAAVEQLMYYKQIMPVSFLYSGALTFLFSFLVSALLKSKIKNINMVEALKSVE